MLIIGALKGLLICRASGALSIDSDSDPDSDSDGYLW
jgi:hypothetical protein